MGKRLAAVQSSYLPWKGYFDLINTVDEFVLLDDVQYTRRDWRNRNRIKTKDGPRWLTVPVQTRGRYHEPICAITIADPDWRRRHWRTVVSSYRRARGFAQYGPFFEELYDSATDNHLSLVNERCLRAVARLLGIETRLSWSMDYGLTTRRTERLVELCLRAGAATYVSGPSARDYLDLTLFRQHEIEVEFFDYTGYPSYDQLYPPFDHHVSIIDLILNVGADASRYLLTF
jgi:hypothetical protein